jgi:hypothetical protein
MATIRIAETAHPLHPTRSNPEAITSSTDDGIYNMRAISRASTRERSRDRWNVRSGEKEAEDDDPGLRQAGDYKAKQVCQHFSLTMIILTYDARFLKGNFFSGFRISPLVSFMVILERVLFMCFLQHSRRRLTMRTCWACFRS